MAFVHRVFFLLVKVGHKLNEFQRVSLSISNFDFNFTQFSNIVWKEITPTEAKVHMDLILIAKHIFYDSYDIYSPAYTNSVP